MLIEQYLPIIFGSVYSRHRSFMWFVCLNWHKSTFYPATAPDDFKMLTYCDVIDTWAGRWQLWFMETFLSQWRWGQWLKEFVKYTSMPSFSNFIIERIWRYVNCLASDVIINWRRATRTTWIKAFMILQWWDSMRTTCGVSTEQLRNPSIWFAESRNYVN